MMGLTALAVCGFNAAADPFGLFGDRLLDWYAYDMTNNPRVAKVAYLDRRHEAYDSYIIGCSKTSSFSTSLLDTYYGDARFYNMIMYGGDMYDIRKTAEYVLENYQPKNIIVALGLEEAVRYNYTEDVVKNGLHAKVDGQPVLPFYARYLLLNPSYGLDKLAALADRTRLPSAADVFLPETGVYNKERRDAESVRTLTEFLEKNPGFEYDLTDKEMACMAQAVSDVAAVKAACEAQNVDFKLIMTPIYYKEADNYQYEELVRYWTALAEVTDFWDFSGYSPVSYDERYFYDAYHFRNSVGDMVLTRAFGDGRGYLPEGFGHLTTRENVRAHAARIFTNSGAPPPGDYSQALPVLLYHDIREDPEDGAAAITPRRFRQDMEALKAGGYTAIDFAAAAAYVYEGRPLPEKPVIITFDDGYRSNYLLAWDILQAAGMKGTVNVISVSAGKSTYKDTGRPIIPHFSYAEAREMFAAGTMDFQSHSYAMHDSPELEDPAAYREGVLPRRGEGEEEYIENFRADVIKSKEEIEEHVGNAVFVYAYPQGYYSDLTEALLQDLGFTVTLSVDPGVHVLVKGLPQSLLAMKRVNRAMWSGDLLRELESLQ
jgi:peptidoglycan/xylan/chitin deacetylase (PgdA/CDA1 family)